MADTAYFGNGIKETKEVKAI